jgi:pyruvate formate lyase activating enzyme
VEARYYRKTSGFADCFLCRHRCRIKPGKTGICGVRKNEENTLKSMVYGRPCSIAVDPIEKKPLFHFKPSSLSLSYATFGCNFRCSFCQNWQISQEFGEPDYVEPEQIVELALGNGCDGIAHTYTEPTIFFEYAFDIAKMAHSKGLYNVFVTNGYTSDQPLEDIKPYLDAANIDLNGFDREFYRKFCGAELDKVLECIKKYVELGIRIEITNLVIPGHNDGPGDIRKLCKWLVENTGVNTPLHFSRYHPSYKLNAPPTPISKLREASEIAKEEGLRFIYIGNVLGEGENTSCYNCGGVLIKRTGYKVVENSVSKGRCLNCGAESYIVS